ncbi:MAG: zf-HC2 domain-containing protein, partial [Roseiflexaceae bacterium]|nr:zf-HC2 domain-containing protein [Roseiflexaceae bacterium]
MKHCSTSGTLRAYLDNELPNIERLAVATHLQQCPECRADLDDICIQAEQVALLLSPPNLPNADVALARIYATARPDAGRVPATQSRRTPMTSSQRIRRWAAPLVALVFAVALLAFPPVRAAADQLLQVLRVQTVVFVPITQERMEQLKNLNFDDKTLFLAEPKVINQPGEPQEVATADAASALVGFPVEQPANLPSTPTQTVFHVNGRTIAEFQINVASARELLKLTGVDDVTLPDALGAQPINVDMAPAVLTTYSGDGYTLQLIQGRAPQVNLPEGVDLRQLGRAALRVLGMAPEQADAL